MIGATRFPAGLLAYLVVCAIGVQYFLTHADTTPQGIALAGTKAIVYIALMTAVFIVLADAADRLKARIGGQEVVE